MSKDDDRPGMFQPLSEQEHERASKGSKSCVEDIHEPIVPAPGDAPEPNWERLTPKSIRDAGGTFTKSWTYHTAEGGIAFHAGRWDLPGRGKGFRPATWCGGRWQLKAMPGSRPLYNLPAIAGEPDKPIVVVEGEKCADTATGVFPDCAATTWAGGSNSWELTDWQPLAGRDVLLVSDADETGREAIKGIACRLADLGCVVRIYLLPGNDHKDIVDLLVDSDAACVSLHIEEQAAAWPSAEHDESIARSRDQSVAETAPSVAGDVSGTPPGGDWTSELVERAKTDNGAPFESDMLIKLRALQRNDPANSQRLFANLRDKAKIPITELKKELSRNTGIDRGDNLQGQPIEWAHVEPWPEVVGGAALLDDLAGLIQQYVTMPEHAAFAVALWIVHTWLHDRLEISTFLNITSATKRCGKTLLLELLTSLVYRPMPVSGRITSAALFRTIELYAPTLLLDEADTFMGDDPELRGVVNGSQRRSMAYVVRAVGQDYEPRQFGTFCPKAISGIGDLPDTVLDRSLTILLERRTQFVGNRSLWRDRDEQAIKNLRRMLARWTIDNAEPILERRKIMAFPTGLHDRARDAWEILLAIGEVAGGDWAGNSGRAWQACEAINTDAKGETGVSEMLLADLCRIFRDAGDPPVMSTADILGQLKCMDSRPWPEWSRGKELSARGLAKLLSNFRIVPGTVRLSDRSTPKGYKREVLAQVWERYVPPTEEI